MAVRATVNLVNTRSRWRPSADLHERWSALLSAQVYRIQLVSRRSPPLQRSPSTSPDHHPSHPQVRLPYELAAEELPARPLEHDAPGLEHVASRRELERRRHVLLDQEHRQPL